MSNFEIKMSKDLILEIRYWRIGILLEIRDYNLEILSRRGFKYNEFSFFLRQIFFTDF